MIPAILVVESFVWAVVPVVNLCLKERKYEFLSSIYFENGKLPFREIIVVARGDEAATATVAGLTLDTGIICADFCCII